MGQSSNEYHRNYVASRRKTDDEFRLKQNAYILERKRKYATKVAEIKAEKGCMDCGEKDPIVLDFDHKDGVEKFKGGIAKMVRQTQSWETLLEEIIKCDVRCANCHRRRTAKQKNWHIGKNYAR